MFAGNYITESTSYADVIFFSDHTKHCATQTQLTPVYCTDVHFEVHCIVLWQKRVGGIYEEYITGQRPRRDSSRHLLMCIFVWACGWKGMIQKPLQYIMVNE